MYVRYETIWRYRFVSFRFRLYGKVESFKRTIRFVCLFNCPVAELRKNDCIENKQSHGLHIQLGAPYKRVALGKIRCFCFSQAARDVQQVKRQQILHFARMGYKPPTIYCMLREEGLIANWIGINRFLQKHRETNYIERRPFSDRPTKMMAGRWGQSSGVALLWAGRPEAVSIASWFASKIKWSVSSGYRNISVMPSTTWYGQTKALYRWRLTDAFAAASEDNHRRPSPSTYIQCSYKNIYIHIYIYI